MISEAITQKEVVRNIDGEEAKMNMEKNIIMKICIGYGIECYNVGIDGKYIP